MHIFLLALDMFRMMGGLLAANFIFSVRSCPRRENFVARAVCGFIAGVAFSMLYILIQLYYEGGGSLIVYSIMANAWWVFLTLLSSLYVILCFNVGICDALYRTLFGTTLQHIATVILKYWIVGILLPDFQEKHALLYVVCMLCVYAALYVPVYFLIKKRDDGDIAVESKKNFVMYFFMIVVMSAANQLVGGVLDWVLPELENYPELSLNLTLLRYFCVGVSLLYCGAFIAFNLQRTAIENLRREKSFQQSVLAEKTRQYELSKSSIEIINRKCHDLKHQISALRFASDKQREQLLEEAKNAAMIYDSGVHTDNEVLNVLLTEKSLYCMDKGIKLSCNINTKNVDRINVIDLYTMLGNAIDNAVEGVSRLKEDDADKRTISITIDTVGGMLLFEIVNYYGGEIKYKDGRIQTSKADKVNHGIGLRSIKFIAEKYGGVLQVKSDGGVFVLRIVIPVTA